MRKKKISPVVIIGAGPIGCYLAQLLRKKGLEPFLIEEHKELGRPIHCAGLVGRKVFAELTIPFSKDCILNTINGAVIHFDKERIEIKRRRVAYVIDRERFDKELGARLKINFETKFLGLEKENSQYIIETDKREFKSDVIVGADGAQSLLREYVTSQPMSWLRGVQFRMERKPAYIDKVEVYIEKPYFYWIIPESKNILRIGVLSQNPYHDLLAFIERKGLQGKIVDKFAGVVPLTHFTPIARQRLFLVGDSAAQVKPLTYGGIYMGMRAAELLADCIIREKFSEYSFLWQKKFGKEIGIPLKARQIFHKLSDRDIKKIFSFVKRNINIIEEKGDFENHFLLIWELLKRPRVSKDILSILLDIFKTPGRENL